LSTDPTDYPSEIQSDAWLLAGRSMLVRRTTPLPIECVARGGNLHKIIALRDSNLTHGKIVVGVTIGISGRVKGVRVDAPISFRALEPCIKEMVGRWTFPQSYEEYGTEFSYLCQGNE